jgi:hypothetical protein
VQERDGYTQLHVPEDIDKEDTGSFKRVRGKEEPASATACPLLNILSQSRLCLAMKAGLDMMSRFLIFKKFKNN